MPRIGLLWDSVSNNMGDKAIGLLLQRALSAHGIPHDVVDPFTSQVPEDIVMLIIGGGELIRPAGDPFYDAFRVRGRHILNTVGVLEHARPDFLDQYRLVTVRSEADRKRLGQGEIVPCLTLLYDEYLPARPALDIPKGAIGINLNMSFGAEEAMALVHWLRETKLGPIVFLPITHYNGDHYLMQVLAGQVPGATFLEPMTPDETFAAIGKLSALVSSSLHATLFAYTQGVPVIGFHHPPKIGAFLRDRGLKRWIFRTTADLRTLLPALLDAPPATTEHRDRDRAACRALIRRFAAISREALSEGGASPIMLPPTRRDWYEVQMHSLLVAGEQFADSLNIRLNLQSREIEVVALRQTIEKQAEETKEAWRIATQREAERDEARVLSLRYEAQRDEALAIATEAQEQRDIALSQLDRLNVIERELQALRADYEAHVKPLEKAIAEGNVPWSTLRDLREIEQQYDFLQRTLVVRFARRYIWPVTRRLRRLRHAPQILARKILRRKPAPDILHCGIDNDLTEPFVVGGGSVYNLRGWCYHPDLPISELEIFVDGVPYQVVAHSLIRPDVMQDQAMKFDRKGNSLMSGFHAMIPFEAVSASKQVSLLLRATLSNGQRVHLGLGQLNLVPARTDIAKADVTWRSSGARVAICMTTYNPPLELFQRQVQTLKEQTHTNWVCIINDDSSSDEIFEQIRAITAADPRFYVFRSGGRLGFYHNFEQALYRVPESAEFVAMCDQDDDWYPDKLSTCLEAFTLETQLVYSDMDIVTRDGKLISRTYWTTRRNNYTDLNALLFANTVTGAASVFRASLLRDALPFPERIGDSYHDHWLACVALAKGKIGYVDRPLYAYRQHGANVLGHYVPNAVGLFPGPKKLLRWARSPRAFRADVRDALWFSTAIYLNDVLRLSLIARTLSLRLPNIERKKRGIVRRLARVDRSVFLLFRQGIQYKLFRRPTLGAEWYCLRGLVGHRLLQRYYRRNLARFFHEFIGGTTHLSSIPTLPAPDVAKIEATGTVKLIQEKIAPLRLNITPEAPVRVNLILPTIDFRLVFGGYIGKFNLALMLQKHGYRVRLVVIDWTDVNLPLWREQITRFPGISDLLDRVEIEVKFDRSVPLEVNPQDRFIATTWWTAHVAHDAIRQMNLPRFLYFIQEYEPMTFPMGSYYALADESYTFPHDAVFSTELLREYFCLNRLGVFRQSVAYGEEHSIAFQNAINKFTVTRETLSNRSANKLLFYARPEQHAARNMFEMAVLGLSVAVERGVFSNGDWTFSGIGSLGNFDSLKLPGGHKLSLLPRMGLKEYLEVLPAHDIGLSLMLTPHPSLVPLEMAAAGMLTVTNTYANKTADKLRAISSNIIPVPPTIEGVVEGLSEAVSRVGDFDARLAGAQQVNWATDWDTALGGAVLEKIKTFLA